MGIPVSPKNIFPSNIQGLPTWYEVRVSEAGYLARRDGIDLMVAMNPQTYAEDLAEVVPGGWLLYDSSMPRIWPRDDITVLGMPIAEICAKKWNDPRQRQLFKNMVYVGALSALLDMDIEVLEGVVADQLKGKEKLVGANMEAVDLGRDYAHEQLPLPAADQRPPCRRRQGQDHGHRQRGRRARRGLCRRHGLRLVSDHAVDVARRGLREARHAASASARTARSSMRIVQAEDELAAIGVAIGGAWNGARSFTATSGPGISLMSEFLGLAYFAEIPVVLYNIQRGGPSTGMPTRTEQSDIISCAYASHGDTKHVLLFPSNPTECFSMGADAFDLAERLQTPVMVMCDLDIGMNDWMTDAVRPGTTADVYDRGKVLDADARGLREGQGHALGPLPGRRRRRHPLPHAAGHASDEGRLLHPRHQPRRERALHRGRPHPRPRPRPHPRASSTPPRRSCPSPRSTSATRAARSASSTSAPTGRRCSKALDLLERDGVRAQCACASRPSRSARRCRRSASAHDQVFVVEQNRDAQMRHAADGRSRRARRRSSIAMLNYDGMPMTAEFVAGAVLKHLRRPRPRPQSKPPAAHRTATTRPDRTESPMSYIAKPIAHHPALPKNALGLTHRDYEGSMSTLCAGCGHDSITAAIIEACYEMDLPAHRIAKLSRHRLLVEDADLLPRPQPRLQLRARPHAVGDDRRQPRQPRPRLSSACPATATPPRSASASSRTPSAAS